MLRLTFHDVEETQTRFLGRGPESFLHVTPEQATQIAEFARRWVGQVPLMVVHCEGGISRSAAAAAAISRYFNGVDSFFFEHYVPNRLVYRRVLEALQQDDPSGEEGAHPSGAD